jgi:PBSX family phage terminase large subunit
MLQSCFGDSGYKLNETDYIVTFPNGAEIWLGGLDDKERTDKILGQEYAAIFLNEAVRIMESTVEKVRTRLAQNIEGFKNFIIYDCNPRHPLHWIYQKFYMDKPDYCYQLHWLPEDNIENLPDDYLNILDDLKGHEKERFRHGRWAALPGAVYNNIKSDNILELEKDWGLYEDITIGVDFGFYSAITIYGIRDNMAFCLFEIDVINGTTKQMIKELDEIWKDDDIIREENYPLYCDHELDRIQEFTEAGYNAKKAYKEVQAGDSTVNDFEILFDTECKNTFQSCLNLQRQQDMNGTYIDKHVKENDHEADCTRYALHGYKRDNASVGNFEFF